MAVILCLFNYDANTQKLSLETHVMAVDPHDTIQFVTHTAGLTLKSEVDFKLLNLKAGDHAPIRYTTQPLATNVPEFKVYYHGPMGQFACGTLDTGHNFQSWPHAVGQQAPGNKGGG